MNLGRESEAIDYVLHTAMEEDVKFIRLWFADILGNVKGIAITVEELEDALVRGVTFDGSSIQGFARDTEWDMVLLPDPTTFRILPWRPRQNAVARMFCDIMTPQSTPFDGDPRNVLKQSVLEASRLGLQFYVGPDIEFFYFRSPEDPSPVDGGGYFDQTPGDVATDLRRETVLNLSEMGIPVKSSYHEGAPGQHEVDLQHTDALTMADNVMTARLVIKEVALSHGLYATFMPKPIGSLNGSGMHVHMSLFRGGENAFYDPDDPIKFSRLARQFMAGLLRHAPEISIVTNQWVNSYKRLVAGYEAPVYVSWASMNSSDLVRVPSFKQGREESVRLEYRAPDPACNPYLAFAALLTAGLMGIRNEYDLPPQMEGNVFEMTEHERAQRGIQSLPGSLLEAIHRAEDSECLRLALGDRVVDTLLTNKRIEWERYRTHVTDYEIREYLPQL
ncbi:MAG: glutamine synthetase family protein [Chloroflexi bacterium]|nr:glutamine synthetase family protein [Chloroflexota bacterium]